MATFVVSPRDDVKSDAVWVNFTNGRLKTDEGITFRKFESAGKEKGKTKSLVAETDDMVYVGKNTDMLAPKTSAYGHKYMVGVLDKKTGKVRVYSSEMYNLQPQLAESDLQPEEKSSDTYRDKLDALTSAFGGSKKKRAMESRRKNEIMGDKLEGVITKAATDALTDKSVLDTPQEEKNTMVEVLPPFNMDATTPAEVFPFKNIISNQVLEACKVPAQVFVDADRDTIKQWTEAGTYPKYILTYLSRLPINEDARLHKAACLVYLNHLIFMFRITYKELRRKDVMPSEMPAVVKKTLLETFTLRTVAVGRGSTLTMPARKKDKVLSYILLLCLHMEEFLLEYETLLVDLKMSQQRMKNHLYTIGCKVTTSKDKGSVVHLPVPLKFGAPPVKRTKKR